MSGEEYVGTPRDGGTRLELSHTEGRVTKEYIAYPAGGELVTVVREHFREFETDDLVKTREDRQHYELADDGETLVHAGLPWREYATGRHKTLVRKRFNIRGEIHV